MVPAPQTSLARRTEVRIPQQERRRLRAQNISGRFSRSSGRVRLRHASDEPGLTDPSSPYRLSWVSAAYEGAKSLRAKYLASDEGPGRVTGPLVTALSPGARSGSTAPRPGPAAPCPS